MKNVTMNIIHSIPGRMRLSLNCVVHRTEKVCKKIESLDGLVSCSYSEISGNFLIYYKETDIGPTGVIKELILAIAEDIGHYPVSIRSLENYKLTPLAKPAAVLIVFSSFYTLLGGNLTAKMVLQYSAALMTGVSVVDHGISEIKRTGTFDFENLSLIYLINSLGEKKVLQGTVLTWLATYIRHLLPVNPPDAMVCRIVETHDSNGALVKEVMTNGFIGINQMG